jgi:hypothetical protein
MPLPTLPPPDSCVVLNVLDPVVPTVVAVALPLRFLFRITSVFKLSGLTTPCNFRNNPHALQRGFPSGFLLHNGVVVVRQFVHWVIPASFFMSFSVCLIVGVML